MATDPTRLRLDLLRLRGELQRAELAQAAAEVRASTRRWSEAVRLARDLGAAVAGSTERPWLAAAGALLRERPWLRALALVLAARWLRGRRLRYTALAALAWLLVRRTRDKRGDRVT
jgi:hypothetical protein